MELQIVLLVLILVIFIFTVVATATEIDAVEAGCNKMWKNGKNEIVVDGIKREFYIYYPKYALNQERKKVIYTFHGWSLDGSEWMGKYMKNLADKNNYILISPTGLSDLSFPPNNNTFPVNTYNAWNFRGSSSGIGPEGPICDVEKQVSYCYSRSCDCSQLNVCSWTHCLDDVGFVVKLIEHVKTLLCLQDGKTLLFATGASNGGMFTWELGMNPRTAGMFRAIAPMIGLPLRGYIDPPGTNHTLPVLLMTGRKDPTVPPGNDNQNFTESYDGDYFYYVSANAITKRWAEYYNCNSSKPTTRLQDYPGKSIKGNNLKCIGYCGDSKSPTIVDCRGDSKHSTPKWMIQLMFKFFNLQSL